jgi:hypothetical protein
MVINVKLTNLLAYSSLVVRRVSHFGKHHGDLPYQLLLSKPTPLFHHKKQVWYICYIHNVKFNMWLVNS